MNQSVANKLSELNKRVNIGAAAHDCFVAVLKNQKEPLVEISVSFISLEIGVL